MIRGLLRLFVVRLLWRLGLIYLVSDFWVPGVARVLIVVFNSQKSDYIAEDGKRLSFTNHAVCLPLSQ